MTYVKKKTNRVSADIQEDGADRVENQHTFNNASRHQIESECSNFIYHLAIIDYLQTWNFDKKCESWLKRTLKGRPKKLISCVPPDSYYRRFNRFINSELLGYKREQKDA